MADLSVPIIPTIAVASSWEIPSAVNTYPPQGDVFVEVNLTLDNRIGTPLPLVATLFSLTTASGLEYQGDARTAAYPSGCDPNAMLVSGAQVQCIVLFVIPSGASTVSVGYRLPSGSTVSAPCSTRSCLCNGTCHDFRSDYSNCGDCGVPTPTGGSCVDGVPTCPQGETDCKNTDNTCHDLTSDRLDCGACGNRCATGACYQGVCSLAYYVPMPVSCDSVCGQKKCLYSEAEYTSCKKLLACADVPPADGMLAGCSPGLFSQMRCICEQ